MLEYVDYFILGLLFNILHNQEKGDITLFIALVFYLLYIVGTVVAYFF